MAFGELLDSGSGEGVGVATTTVVLPGGAPSAGDLLVATSVLRGNVGTTLGIAGWTNRPVMLGHGAGGGGDANLAYRVCDGSETDTFVFTMAGGSPSLANRVDILRFEGPWGGADPFDAEHQDLGGPTASPVAFSGSISPSTGAPVVIVCHVMHGPGGNTVASGSLIEVGEGYSAGGFDPTTFVGYQVENDPAGTYLMQGTLTSGAGYNDWTMRSVSFAGTEPAAPPPVELEVCGPDGADCVLFDNAVEKRVTVEYNGTGSFSFIINRYDPQATAANLRQGNIVRITFLDIDPDPIYEGILEEGDFQLIDSEEEGAEDLTFGGRGTLALLSYSLLGHQWLDLGHPKLNFPAEGVWRWTSEEAAGILRRLIGESNEHTPPALTEITRDWSDTVDSEGNPFFDMDGIWEIPIGQDLLTAAMDLTRAGMFQLEMRPGFLLRAYDDQGEDRSGAFATDTVRFEKGVNIATELSRQMHGRAYTSSVLIHTKTGYLWYPSVDPIPYNKEVLLDLSNTTGTNSQERAAARKLLRGIEETEAILLEHTPTGPNGEENDPVAGFYYPGYEGTANGKYWIGDLVTLHTGDDPDQDFMDAVFRVQAITLYEDEAGRLAPPIVELNARFVGEDTPAPTTGSSSEGGSGAGGSGSPVNAPHVHTQYQLGPHYATADPTVNDDSDDDYIIGSRWLNTATDKEFVALDVTVGAALWQETTGAGAPTGADYLVGTAQAGLSAEIVVGATPGGELGGTWPSPTVDTTHAGSTHDAATNTHIADTVDAHDASAISFSPTGTISATDVQAAIAEVAAEALATVDPDAVRDAGRWEVVMAPGVTSPPEPVETPDGSDWVYGWVPG